MSKDNSNKDVVEESVSSSFGKKETFVSRGSSQSAETKRWEEWASTTGVPAALWKGALAHAKADIDAPITQASFESAVRAFAGVKVQ